MKELHDGEAPSMGVFSRSCFLQGFPGPQLKCDGKNAPSFLFLANYRKGGKGKFMSKKVSKGEKDFREVKSFSRLWNFLKERGRSHKFGYFHYTDADSVASISSNKIWRFSNLAHLNDLEEVGNNKDSERFYCASFSYGESESVAMWGLYSEKLSRAVRMHFKQKSFLRFFEELEVKKIKLHAYDADGNEIVDFFKEPIKVNATLGDVVYKTKKNNYRWYDYFRGSDEIKGKNDTILDYFIKNEIWYYEREVRILIELPAGLKLSKGKSTNNKQASYPAKIGIDCTSLLDNFDILCGPCIRQEELSKEINAPVKDNDSYHKLRIVSHCRHPCANKENCPIGKNL